MKTPTSQAGPTQSSVITSYYIQLGAVRHNASKLFSKWKNLIWKTFWPGSPLSWTTVLGSGPSSPTTRSTGGLSYIDCTANQNWPEVSTTVCLLTGRDMTAPSTAGCRVARSGSTPLSTSRWRGSDWTVFTRRLSGAAASSGTS